MGPVLRGGSSLVGDRIGRKGRAPRCTSRGTSVVVQNAGKRRKSPSALPPTWSACPGPRRLVKALYKLSEQGATNAIRTLLELGILEPAFE